MAQIIPPITSLPMDSSAAPSVEDIQDRLPSICVDYLSHDWSEEDVWASWRSMTRHKHEIANGVRLENASWRTWQKQRNKLKTISPETLNWLKDSDVTWLYGPLHTAHVEPVRPLKVSSAVDRLGIDRPQGTKKTILKHRTLSEMLTIPMPSSPILESSMSRIDDVEPMDDQERPILLQTKSDTNIVRTRNGPTRKKSPPRGPISGKATPSGALTPQLEAPQPNGKRHISFNTFVEQCVAVEDPQEAVIQEESDDDMLEMRSSTSTSSRSSRPSLSRNSSSSSAEPLTIAKIAPTMLKTTGTFPSQPVMIYAPPPEYASPPLVGVPPPAFDIPSPTATRSRWKGDEDDEYDSVGFDYFGGPDLGGGDASQIESTASHVGTVYDRAPVVNQPPQHAKWRQSAGPIVSESMSTSPQSTAAPLNNNVSSTPQPTRSILKVRQPGTTPPEPSSPPPSYFNYNPSPATGIGGMRGSYEYPGPTTSPSSTTAAPNTHPVVAANDEHRGRSAMRDRGSSAYDRSTSRGTSSGSTASQSPGASRSPVEPPARRSTQGTAQLDKLEEGVSWEPEPIDVEYVPERTSTPTPHSSPQIPFRPLKDASPASLPHNRVPDLPHPDPPNSLPPTSSSGVRATIAHVSTNARPTLSQPLNTEETALDGDGEVDGDGSSIMGRAANIASTAKDLLGALWYGANEEPGRMAARVRGHRRGASLG